ncbi:MAG: alpha-amylase [Flavobacteriaceae bacterium]|nr:alpha-amylase [Flavobacteriaceae bacterium]
MKQILVVFISLIVLSSCDSKESKTGINKRPFVWEAANVYFLLTDRFYNGDTSNDINFDRTKEPGKLRGFEGGDVKGIIKKLKDGYFTKLGVNAIWMTPIVEQIHGGTDEGTGVTYGFHGYWTKDWTKIEPNYGTKEDVKELVELAHEKGIRVLLDAVINHTGPVTEKDPVWPTDWVRTEPQCTYKNSETTIPCTLVRNLPDVKTESNEAVKLPPYLVEKWKNEGRYEEEVAELDAFFKRTGYPRAPRFYIIKWLTDYITEFGIDGYRVDTVKHVEDTVWQEFKKECDVAFNQWKKDNPKSVLDQNQFYLVGEVYGYGIGSGQYYDFGDKKVNYFDGAFQSLINFQFKWDAKQKPITEVFDLYANSLQNDLKGFGTMNYISSHDDGQPYDAKREKSLLAGTLLLLAPGTSQIYYGDESARSLVIEGTVGDATLRSFMNWEEITTDEKSKQTVAHWQKLGQFRNKHISVGAGVHQQISEKPYVFSRTYSKENYGDKVVIGLNLLKGKKSIAVGDIFSDGELLRDAYTNKEATVVNGKIELHTEHTIVLLEKKR